MRLSFESGLQFSPRNCYYSLLEKTRVFENETNAKQIHKDRALAIDKNSISIASALSLGICLAFVSFSKTNALFFPGILASIPVVIT